MFSQVQDKFGKLDIFVSSARPDLPTFYHSPMQITLDHWRAALDSQAQAFLLGTQKAAKLMPDEGRIVAITYSPSGRTETWQPWAAMGVLSWLFPNNDGLRAVTVIWYSILKS